MKISPFFKKILSVFIVITLLTPALLLPKKTAALTTVFDPARFAQEAFQFGIDTAIQNTTMGEAIIQTIKQIAILAEDVIQTAKLTYLALKEAVLDPIAKLLGAQLANQLVNQMFSFVTKGNKGVPAFVTNPQQYFGSIAEESTQVFLTDLQNNRPERMASINNAVRQRIIEENYVDPKRKEQSTFPGGDAGYKSYLDDQSKCATGNSWDCYFATLEPQNDPWQIYQFERAQLAAKRGTDVKLAQDEVIAGAGFHTLKSCIERDGAFGQGATYTSMQTLTGSESQELNALLALSDQRKAAGGLPGTKTTTTGTNGATFTSMQTLTNAENQRLTQLETLSTQRKAAGGLPGTLVTSGGGNCTEYLNKTPGDTIARQTNEYLTSQLRQVEQADEVDEVITVGIGLVQKFMSGMGLTGVTNEVGTRGIDQGNGVTTFPIQNQGGPTNITPI